MFYALLALGNFRISGLFDVIGCSYLFSFCQVCLCIDMCVCLETLLNLTIVIEVVGPMGYCYLGFAYLMNFCLTKNSTCVEQFIYFNVLNNP